MTKRSEFQPITLAADGRPIHEQQPEEPAKAYGYFLKYVNMGRSRSYTKVVKALNLSMTWVSILGHRYHWKERAISWDAARDQEAAATMQDAIRDVASLHVKMGNEFYRLVHKAIERLQKEADLNDPDVFPDPAKVAQWITVAEKAAKIQRSAMGQADAVALQGPDGGPIQVHHLTQEDLEFQELMREAKAKVLLEGDQRAQERETADRG